MSKGTDNGIRKNIGRLRGAMDAWRSFVSRHPVLPVVAAFLAGLVGVNVLLFYVIAS